MNAHTYAALGVVGWTLVCVAVDALALRLFVEGAADDGLAVSATRPLRREAVGAVGVIAALAAGSSPDPLQGAGCAVAIVALTVGGLRDMADRVLWPELFTLALAVEVGLRTLDGHAYDAALGLAAFGIVAWVLVMTLQALRVPQGFGDVLPAFLIGSAFPMQAGIVGVSAGFLVHAALLLVTRVRSRRTGPVAMGPAFALTSIAATFLTAVWNVA